MTANSSEYQLLDYITDCWHLKSAIFNISTQNVEYEKFSTFVGAFSVENHVENVENSWFYRYLQAVENFIL